MNYLVPFKRNIRFILLFILPFLLNTTKSLAESGSAPSPFCHTKSNFILTSTVTMGFETTKLPQTISMETRYEIVSFPLKDKGTLDAYQIKSNKLHQQGKSTLLKKEPKLFVLTQKDRKIEKFLIKKGDKSKLESTSSLPFIHENKIFYGLKKYKRKEYTYLGVAAVEYEWKNKNILTKKVEGYHSYFTPDMATQRIPKRYRSTIKVNKNKTLGISIDISERIILFQGNKKPYIANSILFAKKISEESKTDNCKQINVDSFLATNNLLPIPIKNYVKPQKSPPPKRAGFKNVGLKKIISELKKPKSADFKKEWVYTLGDYLRTNPEHYPLVFDEIDKNTKNRLFIWRVIQAVSFIQTKKGQKNLLTMIKRYWDNRDVSALIFRTLPLSLR